MGRVQLRKVLSDALGVHYGPLGFCAESASPGSLLRLRGTVCDAIDVNIGGVGSHNRVICSVGVQWKAVEELVRKCEPGIPWRSNVLPFTLVCDVGYFVGKRNLSWWIERIEDVAHIMGELAPLVDRHGLAFFDRYSDPECVIELLMRDDSASSEHCVSGLARAMKACAMLAILGRAREIPYVGREKRDYIASGGGAVDYFEAFLDRLIAVTASE